MNGPDQKPRILLVEDDPDGRRSVADALAASGCEVAAVDCGNKAVELSGRQDFDAVLSDIKLPDIDGIQVLKLIRQSDQNMPVLLMTAYGAITAAVEALKAGAYDYIVKPLDLTDLQAKVSHAVENRRLRRQVVSLKKELFARPIIAQSRGMRAVLKQVETVAPTHANVLILGESGTGKELVARALHAQGKNPEGKFIAVNCGAFAESLLESELFGHEKGAFTGATQMRPGAFERAHGGSLFLDEIGLASPHVQARLLRVLEEKEVIRVGGSKTVAFETRIIAASNRGLEELTEGRLFRHDLLYRLKVVTIRIPPLRERPDDIRPLADYFMAGFCKQNGRHIESVTPDFYAAVEKYEWPGNVRELRNAIESAVVLAGSPRLTAADISLPGAGENLPRPECPPAPVALAAMERELILNALRRHKGSRTLAARELDVSVRTIQRKIKDYNLPF
ncbi:MAG: sigma-54 dependent transcriptional regulator [Kiritimatiellae bacterium]|nr:sigma-54 dependent transcriptional regulator [Kiritimatiellia bacterium]